MGLKTLLSPRIGEILGDGSLPMQGDLEGQFLIHDTKVLNSELSVAV